MCRPPELEIRVIAGHVATPPRRLQTCLGPDPGHSDAVDAQGPSLRELQCVEPSAGLRCTVQLIMRASKRSLPAATALSGWRFQRPERPLQKTLSPQFDGIDAATGCD